MFQTIRLLLVNQVPVERAGIQAVLNDATDITVVAETDNAREAIRLCGQTRPDVVLTTFHVASANPVDFVTRLRQHCPQTNVVFWSSSHETAWIRQLIAAGITGYLLKGASPEAILQTIRAVIGDVHCFSPAIIAELAKQENKGPGAAETVGLTERERQILRLMAQGMGNARIAIILGLSPQTVRNYSSAIFTKLGVHSRIEAILWARENGLNGLGDG